jgi:peptidoglycan/xylan/chitin deacetylase (PgdA/CDA1 family)
MRRRTSIVIPARNAERTLAEALNSLIAQTDADWEAVIVDDGSTDATSAIIAEFASRDSRFINLVGRGEGASAARNLGLSKACGKWLLFLDSDDWIGPSFLAAMHAALDGQPDAVAAYCADQRVTPAGEPIPLRWSDEIARSAFDVFARFCGVSINSVLVDCQLVKELGGFDARLRTCEDWDLWQRVARTGGRFVGVAQPLAFYRMSDHSLSHDLVRMIADARVVIERGFAPDPRVGAPAPLYAAGASSASGRSAQLAFACFCLWCAAIEVGRGGDGRSLLVDGAAIPESLEDGASVERLIVEALMIGARCPPRELAVRWPSFGRHLVALINTFASASPLPGFARRIQTRIERRILLHFDLSIPAPLAVTMGLRVDIRALESVRPPPGVDLLYFYLCQGDRILAIHELPVFGIVTERQWAALAIQILGFWPFYEGARLSRRPSLWWCAARDLAKLMRKSLASPAPRASLRILAREAIELAAVGCAGPAETSQASDRVLAELVAQARREDGFAGGPPTKPLLSVSRADLLAGERADGVPVLLYHRIAEDGPKALSRFRVAPEQFLAQMQWLSRHGYRAISSADLASHLESALPFAGRPILITFDDGMLDFYDAAWPILRECDLTAEVFLATDSVGAAVARDRNQGPSAPSMTPAQILALHRSGAHFGSHLASYSAVDCLSSRELALELTRSRCVIEAWLGQPVQSFAAPYGIVDERLFRLADFCGYRAGFTTMGGIAKLGDDPLRVPRIEVRGEWRLNEFTRALEGLG